MNQEIKMGKSGLFRCDRCGYEAELNFSQPDSGMLGNVEQFFCPAKQKIAQIFRELKIRNNVPEYPVCNSCTYNSDDEEAIDIDEKIWYDAHPECRMENLQPLILIADGENIAYHCPRKNCKGIMKDTGELLVYWD